MPGGKNVIASGRFQVSEVYFWGGMAEGSYFKSIIRVKLYNNPLTECTILQVVDAMPPRK